MPITYKIDHSLRVVLVEWSDVVTSEELANHIERMLADEEAIDCRRSITDTRQASSTSFDFKAILGNLMNTAKPRVQPGSWKVAVIVNTPHLYGVGRQFQAVSDDFIEMSFFADEASALEWVTH
jgi:TnpA family transposase